MRLITWGDCLEVCITGGAGFIGSNLAKFLSDKGHGIKIIDDLSAGNRNVAYMEQFADFVKGSILDKKVLSASLAGCDAVVHLAAKTSIAESVKNPDIVMRTNVEGTKNVLESCIDCDVKKLIFTSSAAVYSDSVVPVSESAATAPKTPYGASKLEAEKIIREYSVNGVKFSILRLFNVYGPLQVSDAVIPKMMRAAISKSDITIMGGGNQTRDFIFVDDVAAAIEKSIAGDACANRTINIGTGVQTRIADLAGRIKHVARSESKIRFVPDNSPQTINSCANITLYRKLIAPLKLTDLDKGLEKTFQWMRMLP